MKKIQKSKLTRRNVILVTLTLCLVIGAVLLWRNAFQKQETDRLQSYRDEWKQELLDRRGEYDEQSIVLTNTSKGAASTLAKKLGARLRITKDGSFATLTLPQGTTILDICCNEDYLAELPQMSADYKASISDLTDATETDSHIPTAPQYTVTDTGYAAQSYLDYLNLRDVWSKTLGDGITVAVIDTGIDTDHPEFEGRISELSYNATEDKIVRDYTLTDGSLDWSLIEDEQGHGTSVAGVIGAPLGNDGIVGVAPNVTLLIIKAECDENGQFKRSSDLVFGLYYAIECDANVVNMSFGAGGDEENNPYREAAQLAVDSDIICVAAAGNNASSGLTYPAADKNVLGVGALDTDSWQLADYSNFGENTDFVAPGTTYTTVMGGGYGIKTGTSLASPLAAGAVALCLAQDPYQEFLQVQELIYASCHDLGDLGFDWYYGYGALDISALLLEERGTVTFHMMTDELENTQQIFIRNHTLQNIPEPERLYAIFDGWYYDPHCTDEYDWYADEFSSNLTLYAGWVNEDDGIPYTYVTLDDGTVEIRSYTGHRRYITIPDMIDGKIVSSIGRSAFSGNTRLRLVNLPAHLVYIRDRAFSGCANLVGITLPDTVREIGQEAFLGNIRLSYVSMTEKSELTTIGSSAFSRCTKLRSIMIPKGVVIMDGSSFQGTTSMISFEVQTGNTAFLSQDGAILTSDKATLVAYPAALKVDYRIPDSVTTVGSYAFSNSKTRMVDLNKVQAIQNNAFEYSALTAITFPDSLTSLTSAAFFNCANLKTISFGGGLTDIAGSVFQGCSALQSVTIPAGIQSIESQAFFGCSSLSTLTIFPNATLKTIGSKAFTGCPISELTLPASLESIGAGAFINCPLTSVTFAENAKLHTIGANAFSQTFRLQAITFPSSLKSIGEMAFSGSGLLTVTLPQSLTTLGVGAFASCQDLTEILVEDGNAYFLSENGVLFDIAKTTLLAFPAGHPETVYTIPDGVTAVESLAFSGAQKLLQVVFSDSILTVGERAFASCSSVMNYRLSSSLTSIGDYAFSKNYSLRSLSFGNQLMQIGKYAFSENWSMSQVTFTAGCVLPRISYGSFANCGLTSFTVPASVASIAQGAFQNCPLLTTFTFEENSLLPSISAYMFSGCINLSTITFLPGSALTSIQAHGLEGMRKLTAVDFGDAKLTNIDNFAFRFCESLTTLDIPEGVTNIGRYAFYNCLSLTTLTIPESVEHIGRYAFLGAENLNVFFAAETLPAYLQQDWDHGITGYYVGVDEVLTEGDYIYAILESNHIALIKYLGSATQLDLSAVNLGGNIINIGGKAFADSAVEQIVLPDTLTVIQASAFYNSALKSLSLPASVQFIGREAFAETPITSLTVAGGSLLKTIEQSAFENTAELQSVTIPASVTTLGRAVFRNSGITSLTFENGTTLTEIPEEAFAYTLLTSLTIPDSVTLINHNAFRETAQLQSVTFGKGAGLMLMSNAFYRAGITSLHIPSNVTYIGEYALVALPNLTAFTVAEDHAYYKAIDGMLFSKDGRKLIAVPAGRTGALTLPQGVESIGFGAFESTGLSSVSFPADSNLLSIGYRAFFGAKQLTSIHIPASVVTIDYYAFAYCDNLKSVTFAQNSGLTGVYEGAFFGCTELSEISLPDGIIEISDFAFYGCAKLTEIPISDADQLLGIYSYAMAYTGLSGELTTPASLIDIGDYAFMGTDVTKVTIPDDNAMLLMIGIGAFCDCNSLTEMTLPFVGASFEDIEITWFTYIFGAGSHEAGSVYLPASLQTVTITEGLTELGEYAFWGTSTLETLHIPHTVVMLGKGALSTAAKYELTNEISLDSAALGSYFGNRQFGTLRLAEGLEIIRNGALPTGISAIYLPASLSEIEDRAFDYTRLKTIEIAPDNLVYASYEGVLYNKELTEIKGVPPEISGTLHLSEGLSTIGEKQFTDRNSLLEIVIPEGVTTIESQAFFSCSNLVRVTLPSTLESIADEAFAFCTSLYLIKNNSTLSIMMGVNANGSIAAHAQFIENADGSIQVRPDTAALSSYLQTADGFLFLENKGNYRLVAYTGAEGTVTLPEKANGQSYSISAMRGGENIIIPGSVKIGSGAFRDNASLKSVVILDGVTSIGDNAFASCTNLETVIMPDTVTTLGYGAFKECSGLREIKLSANLTAIPGEAFHFASQLQSVEIPEKITKIGDQAFRYCQSLESIYVPASVAEIDITAFEYCSSLKHAEFASGNKAFYNKDGIAYTMDGKKMIFAEQDLVGRVVLSEPLTEIPDGAFYGLSAITEIVIPDSVQSIGGRAFAGTSVTELTLPAGLIFLGNDALFSQTLRSVWYKGDLSGWLSMYHGYNNLNWMIDLYIDGKQVTDVQIPDGVKIIPDYAFASFSIERITFPNGLIKIGGDAFAGCAYLGDVFIPSSVTSIGNRAFFGCYGMKRITVDAQNTVYSSCDGILYNKEQTELLMATEGFKEHVHIPEGVTKLDSAAFYNCDIGAVTFPSTLTTLHESAFMNGSGPYIVYNNSSLSIDLSPRTALYVDKNGNQTYAEGYTDFALLKTSDGFLYKKVNGLCTLIAYLGEEKTVTLPLQLEGAGYDIKGMTGILNLVIPEGIEQIPVNAFTNSFCLKSVTVADSVTVINGAAFASCLNLKEIDLPDTITYIGGSAFSGTVPALHKGYWSGNELYIGKYLIALDPEIEYYTLPDWVNAVQVGCFDDCYKLKYLDIDSRHLLSRMLKDLTNLETLVLSGSCEITISSYFNEVPLTLTSLVLRSDVRFMSTNAQNLMRNITGVTVFVENEEKDVRWDENFPGWRNENRVFYGNDWIFASFSDDQGNTLCNQVFLAAQVIRQPWTVDYLDETYRYVFEGYDLDGDGKTDFLPATSTVSISATAVYRKEYRCITEGHRYSTCIKTDDAQHQKSCACGTTLQEAHSWTAGSITKQPTHTVPGIQTYTCMECYATKHSEIATTPDHMFNVQIATDAYLAAEESCDHGKLYYWSCACGEKGTEVFSVGIHIVRHEYASEWSIDDQGHWHVCTRCEQTDEKSEHLFGNWTVTEQATPTQQGTQQRTCQTCGYQQTEQFTHTHTYYQNKLDKGDENGHYAVCDECGALGEQGAHSYFDGDWITVKEPTATEEGERQISCVFCGFTRSEKIPALGTDETVQNVKPVDPNQGGNMVQINPSKDSGSGGCSGSSHSLFTILIPLLGFFFLAKKKHFES